MMKDKVITELLSRIAQLEYEVERLNNIIKEVREYIEPIELLSIKGKMKQDLLEILDKGE